MRKASSGLRQKNYGHYRPLAILIQMYGLSSIGGGWEKHAINVNEKRKDIKLTSSTLTNVLKDTHLLSTVQYSCSVPALTVIEQYTQASSWNLDPWKVFDFEKIQNTHK